MNNTGLCYHSCKFSGRLDSKRIVSKVDCKIYLVPHHELFVMEIKATERPLKEKLAHPLTYNHAFQFMVPRNLVYKKEVPGNRIVASCEAFKKEYKFEFPTKVDRDSVIETLQKWGIHVGEKLVSKRTVFVSGASESSSDYVADNFRL